MATRGRQKKTESDCVEAFRKARNLGGLENVVLMYDKDDGRCSLVDVTASPLEVVYKGAGSSFVDMCEGFLTLMKFQTLVNGREPEPSVE